MSVKRESAPAQAVDMVVDMTVNYVPKSDSDPAIAVGDAAALQVLLLLLALSAGSLQTLLRLYANPAAAELALHLWM